MSQLVKPFVQCQPASVNILACSFASLNFSRHVHVDSFIVDQTYNSNKPIMIEPRVWIAVCATMWLVVGLSSAINSSFSLFRSVVRSSDVLRTLH